MPLPTPNSDEDKSQFIGRCANSEKMRQEYPDEEQRVAVCNSQWEQIKKSDDNTGDDDMSIFDKFFGGSDEDGDKDLLEKAHGMSLDALDGMSADELIASFAQLSVQIERVVAIARSLKEEMEDRDIDVPSNTMARVLDNLSTGRNIEKADEGAGEDGGEEFNEEGDDPVEAGVDGDVEKTDEDDTVGDEQGSDIEELLEKSMPGRGDPDAEVMFVGGSPSRLDMIRNNVFTGPVGATLQEKYASEIDAEGMYITNAVPEYLSDEDDNPREPTEEDIEKWMPVLKRQIEEVWPEHIVALGKSAKMAVEKATGLTFDESDNEWVPHPRALNIHGDSGEVGRKLSRLNKTLNSTSVEADVEKAVIAEDIPPMGPEVVFNKIDAVRRLRSWAGGPRKSDINFNKFSRAFLVRDGDPTNISSYKLPIADVVDGEIKTIPSALRRAADRIDDVDGLSESDRRQLKSSIQRLIDNGELMKSLDISIEKQEGEKRLALGVVMEPEVEDSDGNWATEEEIEDACHYFMKNHQEVGHEHIYKIEDGVHVVESYILRDDANIGGTKVRKGSWIMGVKCENDDVWDRVKKGEYKGFSIDARAIISPEERL